MRLSKFQRFGVLSFDLTAEYLGKLRQDLELKHGDLMLTAFKGEEWELLWWVLLSALWESAS